MQQIPALPVVSFQHNRLNYGEPRYFLASDEGEAQNILRGLSAFFPGDEPNHRYDYVVQVPEHFLEKHPRLNADLDSEDGLENVVAYDLSDPASVAWIDEARRLLTEDKEKATA